MGILTDVPSRVGGAAEYITVKASTVSPAPGKADLAETVALTSVGATALHPLRDVLRLAPVGLCCPIQKVLVRGVSCGDRCG